jgi:hypothetical protein
MLSSVILIFFQLFVPQIDDLQDRVVVHSEGSSLRLEAARSFVVPISEDAAVTVDYTSVPAKICVEVDDRTACRTDVASLVPSDDGLFGLNFREERVGSRPTLFLSVKTASGWTGFAYRGDALLTFEEFYRPPH